MNLEQMRERRRILVGMILDYENTDVLGVEGVAKLSAVRGERYALDAAIKAAREGKP
jgi:hypothetical protein